MYHFYGKNGMKCMLKINPMNTLASMTGVTKPYTGQRPFAKARPLSIVKTTMLGITRGQ